MSEPDTIETIDDLNIVLSNINDVEAEIDSTIIEDELLPDWKERMFNERLEYIVAAWAKLKAIEDEETFQSDEEQEKIAAGLRTLKSTESKIEQAFQDSRDLEESD
ncbi:hypothetical protein F5Y11DRAFT_351515 [Daldinia sp. FL1419]|nr:hypothetical protein F5Y11DRAFT_351515 [Daldinia sp. FL1419]